ncbi:hypothetical protein ACFV1C_00545 [Streptomyces sp. NPDC059605]|uniref:hypothetical protein n=1 Tax=Streptomyces sp. NPDC059605 TaxID=3346882 RepID=UPI003675E594
MAIELSDELIELERAAWAEQQASALTVETAARVQAAVTAHAEATGQSRYEHGHADQPGARRAGRTPRWCQHSRLPHERPSPQARDAGRGRQRLTPGTRTPPPAEAEGGDVVSTPRRRETLLVLSN